MVTKYDTGEIGTAKVNVKIEDMSPVHDMLAKAQKASELINEAMELVDSIANTRLDLRISAVCDNAAAELARITTE